MILKSHDEDVQHEFDTFCKKVLRNEARDYFDELARKRKREVVFSELPIEIMAQLSTCDRYFEEEKTFGVLNYVVYIDDDEIAEAISELPDKKRKVILLYYFLDKSEYEIAKLLHIPRTSIAYQRTSAIKLLKELMGG